MINKTNNLRYKQGVYYKGYWYIMQQHDANAVVGSSVYGGVVKIGADEANLKAANFSRPIAYNCTPTVPYTNSSLGNSNWSVGLAMDEGGNIFLRRWGSEGLTGPMSTAGTHLNYYFELGGGAIYFRNADGSYGNPVYVDLTQCQIYDTYGTLDPVHGVYYGRVEYFNMTGDLSKVGGEAYLWVSSSAMKRCNKIKLIYKNKDIVYSHKKL